MRYGALALVLGVTMAVPAAAQLPMRADTGVERRVQSILVQMTPEEKIDLLGGINAFDVPGLARVGLPPRGTSDSPFGIRADGPSTVYAAGIGLAATWNPELAERVGAQVGRDARARGRHYNLGPGVNIYRLPLNGRNFEYYGEDPWLASRIAVGFISGVQSQGVSSTIKHYLGNNSEYLRNFTDDKIDERALREIYLPTFEAAVKEAHTGAIMPSYNLVAGTYMSANHRLLVDIPKTEWGFDGIMMSDWGAAHSTLGVTNGGLDLEMPSGAHMNRDSLLPLLKSGQVTQATIDDKVRRLLRNAVRFGWLDRPQLDPTLPRYNVAGREAALQASLEGMVLLKNEGGVLPLAVPALKRIAVIGPDAYPAVTLGGGSATIPPFHAVSFLEGIGNRMGAGVSVLYARGLPSLARAAMASPFKTAASGGEPGLTAEVFGNLTLSGTPTTRVDKSVSFGRAFDIAAFFTGDPIDFSAFFGRPNAQSARWTTYVVPETAGTYDFFVQLGGFGGSGARLYVDGKLLSDNWDSQKAILDQASVALDASPHKVVLEYKSETGLSGGFLRFGVVRQGTWVDAAAEEIAAAADAVVVAAGFDPASETEGWDRTFSLPPGQNELIQRIVAKNPKTIVAIEAGGGVDMTSWIDKVPAVIQTWYPGEMGGAALAQLLVGDVNPTGHQPATFDRRLQDNPTFANYDPAPGSMLVDYKEGIFVGYRGYEKNGTTPLFPFGFGLSYTTFKYGNLTVAPAAGVTVAAPSAGSAATGPRWEVGFDVSNTGSRAGAAVPQVYVAETQPKVVRPAKELKGFAKVMLQPGETRHVTIPLDTRSLAYWDVAGKQWKADAGKFQVLVGTSSADIVLKGELALPKTVTLKP